MVNTRSTDRETPAVETRNPPVTTTLPSSTLPPQPNATAMNVTTAMTTTTTTTTFTTTVAAPIPASSIAPSNAMGIEDISRLLSSSFQSQGSIPSPSFSPLTGLNGPPMPADPIISTAMREIINSAVGVARIEFEREHEARIRSLLPAIVEAARRSSETIETFGNLLFPPTTTVAASAIPPASIAPTVPARFSVPPPSRHSEAAQSQANQICPPVPYFTASLPIAPRPSLDRFPPTQPQRQDRVRFPDTPAIPRQSNVFQPAADNFNSRHPMPPNSDEYRMPYAPPQREQHTAHPENFARHNISFHPQFGRQAPSQQSEGTNNHNLSKWGIKFDGTNRTMNVQEFIFRANALRRDYECSEEEFVTKFHQLLDKPALDWYWNQRKFSHFRSWSDLERALLGQFQRYENEFQIQMKILNRRQLPQESFEEFYNAVIQLRNQQRSPYREEEIVEIMRGNLKPSLAQMIFSTKFRSLGDFWREVRRAENLVMSHRSQYQRLGPQPRVSELDIEAEVVHADLEIDAISQQSRFKCWNCGGNGHSWVECVAPRKFFCYKCGHDGVTVINCPKCQGNRPKNPSQNGEVRSTEV